MAACPRTELRLTPRKAMAATKSPLPRAAQRAPLKGKSRGTPPGLLLIQACRGPVGPSGPAVEPELSRMARHSFFKHITLG